ncbi:hypothetical protein RIF29_39662 [Crotalaria pallida]|uniref:Uncharacterized protein n=1 Tax=Crotalaria pallida TaxID=3830 RepID=A0AAN9E276_CROPI
MFISARRVVHGAARDAEEFGLFSMQSKASFCVSSSPSNSNLNSRKAGYSNGSSSTVSTSILKNSVSSSAPRVHGFDVIQPPAASSSLFPAETEPVRSFASGSAQCC